MANDKTTIIIDADASGVADGVKQADQSLGKLGKTVDGQSKNLNRYGEKLGAAFGPGQGLHGRLDSLETPLRDSEGAMARAQSAAISFGNEGATAADKIGSGFLLAGDAIAAFTSGGVVGIAIVAAVTAFSVLNSMMAEEAEAAKKAEEAQKKHAEELKNLGKAAVDAGISIAALQAKEAAGLALSKVRAVEQERIDQRLRQRKLKDELEDLRARESRSTTSFGKEGIQALQAQMVVKAATLKAQDEIVKGMKNKLTFAKTEARQAQAFYLNDLKLSSESAVTAYTNSLKENTKSTAEAITGLTGETAKATAKLAQKAKAQAFDVAAYERQIRRDNADFNKEQRDLEAEFRREEQQEKLQAYQAQMSQEKRLADFSKDIARQRQESFMKTNAVQIAAVNAVIGGLQQMAHDGEISFAALGDAAFTAAGNELVAAGTKHLLAGAAKAFAGIASGNPVAISGGAAEAGQGALMISTGLGLGAVGGAIGRSGGAPAASAPSTPTDTRESRNASGSGGGDGGTTIINFNGPAYDRRGVSQVITSGQRMAKHRRIAGA